MTASNNDRAPAVAKSAERPISVRQAMLQVLAVRPNAKLAERGLGRWIIVDGQDELNATERGAAETPGEAWKDALDWLLYLYRAGLEDAPRVASVRKSR